MEEDQETEEGGSMEEVEEDEAEEEQHLTKVPWNATSVIVWATSKMSVPGGKKKQTTSKRMRTCC